jgi:hypothetical protein
MDFVFENGTLRECRAEENPFDYDWHGDVSNAAQVAGYSHWLAFPEGPPDLCIYWRARRDARSPWPYDWMLDFSGGFDSCQFIFFNDMQTMLAVADRLARLMMTASRLEMLRARHDAWETKERRREARNRAYVPKETQEQRAKRLEHAREREDDMRREFEKTRDAYLLHVQNHYPAPAQEAK